MRLGEGILKTVVIIDDDEKFRLELAATVSAHPNFNVIAKAIGSDDGILFIDHYKPDVIIMDIIMPQKDGIRLIKYIYENFEGYNPYIFVVTAISTSSMEKMLLELDVDFVEFKPVAEKAINEILNQISSAAGKGVKKHIPRKRENDIADVMEDVLLEIGVSSQLFGYICVKTAIYLILDNPNERHQIYKEVPAILKVSKNRVEKNIRRAISACVGTELYSSLFGKYPVNNLKFLHDLAIYIEKRLRGSDYS